MIEYYLITFENTSSTMKAEGYFKEKGVNLMIMPTPTYITKSCGISIRIQPAQGEEVGQILSREDINFKNYFKKENNQFIKVL